jgi:hypothetical protein
VPDLARDTARIAAAALALGALAALLVALLRAEAALRVWYGLDPEHPAGVAAGKVLRRNLTLTLGILSAAAAAAWWPALRRPLDLVLAGLLALNAGLVGAALAAYGGPLAELIAPHATLELLAAALAGAAYLHARRHRTITWQRLAGCATAAAVLLAIGAVLEAELST